jgi:hypothetical protein
MDSSERYEQARRLIKSSKLQEARNLLLPIRHEARAADWIQKIDAHLAKTRGTEQLPKRRVRAPSWVTIVDVALIAIFTFIVGLAVGGYALDLNPEPTSEPIEKFVVITATPLSAAEAPTSNPTPNPSETPLPTPTSAATETPSSGIDASDAIAGKWIFDSDVSALDDSTSYTIGLEAEDSIRAWLSNPTPVLIIRCRNQQYEVYIHADTQLESNLDDEVYTRVRYGDEEPFSAIMDESTTGEAMFFRSGRAVARKLLTINRLVVGFTPFSANPVEAVFDLTGIETAIQPLVDECGAP